MQAELIAALTAGTGRGFTVLCDLIDTDLLRALATAAGSTGIVLAVAGAPAPDPAWCALSCDPAALPLRSHIVDAAVIDGCGLTAERAEEVRRVLAPGGDVRALLHGDGGDAEATLRSAAIRSLRRGADLGSDQVLVARGP